MQLSGLVVKAWKADLFIYKGKPSIQPLMLLLWTSPASSLQPQEGANSAQNGNQITEFHSCFCWLSIKNCPLAVFPLMSHIVVSEEFPTCFNGMAGEISSCHLRTWYSAAITKDSCRPQHVFAALFHITGIIAFLLTVTKETSYLFVHCLLTFHRLWMS